MPCCSAPNCKKRTDQGFRLFRFPTPTNNRFKTWLDNMRKGENWKPTPHSRLCEKHFEPSQFESHRKDGWRKLKPNAIPTLFEVSKSPILSEPLSRKSVNQVQVNGQSPVKLVKMKSTERVRRMRQRKREENEREGLHKFLVNSPHLLNSTYEEKMAAFQNSKEEQRKRNIDKQERYRQYKKITDALSNRKNTISSLFLAGEPPPVETIKGNLDHTVEIKQEPDSDFIEDYHDISTEADKIERKYFTSDNENYEMKFFNPGADFVSKIPNASTVNSKNSPADEFEIYGKFVAVQLRQLNRENAVEVQAKISALLKEIGQSE